MNKKIWYVSKYANVRQFGAETRQASFCKEFAKAGFDVRLILSNSSHLYSTLPKFNGVYKDFEDDGFNVTWVNTLKYKRATSPMRLLSWVWFEFFTVFMMLLKRYERPDIIICSSLSLLSVLSGSFFKFFFKSKFIFEVRDIWPQTLVDLNGLSPKHPLIWCLGKVEKLGYKYADAIVGTMPGLGSHVESVIGDSNKVHFIPQGVSLAFYENDQKPLDDGYIDAYIQQDKFIVTYAGTLGTAYSLDSVIEAAAELNESYPNIHFLFLGDGHEKALLVEKAATLKNVSFAPRVKKEQVLEVLTLSDLLIHSFKMEKVFEFGISPNKFVDYMFAKKPIICMFSGYPSMINEASCGEFVPSEDSLALSNAIVKYSLMSKEELEKIGENGFKFLTESRNFTVLSKKYMELF